MEIRITSKDGKSFSPKWIDPKKRLRRDNSGKIVDPPSTERHGVISNTILVMSNETNHSVIPNSNSSIVETRSLFEETSDKPWVHVQIGDDLWAKGLLDSCSSGPSNTVVNYISSDMVVRIKNKEKEIKKPIIITCSCPRATTSTAVGSFTTTNCITLKVSLHSKGKKLLEHKRIISSFRVAHSIPDDIIIGLHTFREHDLSRVFRHLFIDGSKEEDMLDEVEVEVPYCSESLAPRFAHERAVEDDSVKDYSTTRRANLPKAGSPDEDPATVMYRPGTSDLLPDCPDLVESEMVNRLGAVFLNDMELINKEDLLDLDEDSDPFEEDEPENPAEEIINDSNQDWDSLPAEVRVQYLLKRISDPSVRKAVKTTLESFSEIFRKELPAEPSRIPPFDLELEENNTWNTDRNNKRPPRIQAIVKQYEVSKFIRKATAVGLIRPSQANAWSQVHLTPKKDTGKWRFCIDFRALNDASKPLGWPIPNIKQMILRIGQRRANYFVVIDLTQGYYQVSLVEKSKSLTAFRTAEGLFEWNRLGMGLKGAGSYFQYHMQNSVLQGLLYDILEVYLDDIITWGSTTNCRR